MVAGWCTALAIAMLSACSLPKLAPLAGDARGDDGSGSSGSDASGSGADASHDGATAVDAPSAAAIVVSGTTVTLSGAPVPGAMVAAYAVANPLVPIVMTTTDGSGSFALTLSSSGSAVNDLLEATDGSYLKSYWYFPATLTASAGGITLDLLTSEDQTNVDSMCGGLHSGSTIIGVQVVHDGVAVSGAMVNASLMAQPTCYEESTGIFTDSVNATTTTGVALVLNTGPNVSVALSATEAGETFAPTTATGQQDAFVATQIVEQ